MQETEDLYNILQLQPTARPKAIRGAYGRLRRRYESVGEGSEDATEAMDRLARAFDTLIDPRKRAEYDRHRTDERPSKVDSGGESSPAQLRAVEPKRAGDGGGTVVGPLLEGPSTDLLVAVIVVVLLAVTGAVLFSIITN